MCIYSFAHGGGVFHLHHDAGTIEAAFLAGAPAEAVNILSRLVIRADLDLTERKLLAKLAGKRSGSGERISWTHCSSHRTGRAHHRRSGDLLGRRLKQVETIRKVELSGKMQGDLF